MDEARYIQSYSKIMGLKEENVRMYAGRKGIASLINNADELLLTKPQRDKHKAFLDLCRMSAEIKQENPVLSSPREAAAFMHSVMEHIHDKEAVVAAFVDIKSRLLDYEEVSIGTINHSLIHPREIFRRAIVNKANSIIICHNHPSGDITPSDADFSVTERLREAGELIGINVLDHIIISGINKDDFYSFREHSVLKRNPTYLEGNNRAVSDNEASAGYLTQTLTNEESTYYGIENKIMEDNMADKKPDKKLFSRWHIEKKLFIKDSDVYFLSVNKEEIDTVKELFADFKLKDGKALGEGEFNFTPGNDSLKVKFKVNAANGEYIAEITDENIDRLFIDSMEELIEDIDWHYNDENTLLEFAKSFESSDTGIKEGDTVSYNGKSYSVGFIVDNPISTAKKLYLIPNENETGPETVCFIDNDDLFEKISLPQKSQDIQATDIKDSQDNNKNPLNTPKGELSPKEMLSRKLEDGIKDILSSDNFKNWLDTSSRLFTNNYSLRNALLIYLQKPDASYAMGYEKWKEYGRNVRGGAKAAQIFIPVMAYEKTKGSLYRMITNSLKEQIKQNPDKTAAYRVGTSLCEFTMNKNGQTGLRIDGKERTIFPNQQEMRKFISSAILGKVPMYYSVGSVFDVKDTIIPGHLFVKSGYTADEVVKDKYGNPVKNSRGEIKIINTPKRQAKFQPKLEHSVKEKDPGKMEILYECLKAVSLRNRVPVSEVSRESDENLKNGADGYFSGQFSEKYPKGYIVLPDDLKPTNRCAVLLHEMGHSDLHGDIEKLAASMGEKNISKRMREIQAEAVSYATARQFGIETDTSSFKYLAMYSAGFDLQDLKKSLDVIYSECQKLTGEIKAELELRNLTLELDDIPATPLETDALSTLSGQYAAYALYQSELSASRQKELPRLAADNRTNTELLDVIKDQKYCADRLDIIAQSIYSDIERLNAAKTRQEQDEIISDIEALKRQAEAENKNFSALSESFSEIAAKQKQSLKDEFLHNPSAVLDKLKPDYPELESLSELQLSYIAKSEFIKAEFADLLKNNPDKFVKEACKRAEALNDVISKNGTFVEVKFCEMWTDKPVLLPGELLHPKCAETIIKQAESQIEKLRLNAEKTGDYFPYSKCKLTLFTPSESKNSFADFTTRIDIGDGCQKSLSEHLGQFCDKNGIFMSAFEKSLRERGVAEKIAFNEQSNDSDEKYVTCNSSKKDWAGEISEIKACAKKEVLPDNSSPTGSKSKDIAKES